MIVPMASAAGNQTVLATAGLIPLGGRPLGKSEGPILIQFWASWCQRCSTMFGELAAFTGDHTGLTYLAVSIDKDPKDALAYLKKHETMFNNLKNVSFTNDSKGSLTERFQIETVPVVLLLTGDGTILAKTTGHFTKKDLFMMSSRLQQKKGTTH